MTLCGHLAAWFAHLLFQTKIGILQNELVREREQSKQLQVKLDTALVDRKDAMKMADKAMKMATRYKKQLEDGFSGQNCFPDGVARQQFYQPVERGHEREIAKRLAYWDRLRSEKGTED